PALGWGSSGKDWAVVAGVASWACTRFPAARPATAARPVTPPESAARREVWRPRALATVSNRDGFIVMLLGATLRSEGYEGVASRRASAGGRRGAQGDPDEWLSAWQ